MNTSFKVIDLTQLRIKPESAAPEAIALSTRPPKLHLYLQSKFVGERERTITTH